MNDAQIKHMVDRFLSWRLPENFNPDGGISYTRPNYHPAVDATPTGTNLFDAQQAEAMVRHMTEELSPAPAGEVGWRTITWECKDYADGWIRFNSEAAAMQYQGETGCLLRIVYRLPASPTGGNKP